VFRLEHAWQCARPQVSPLAWGRRRADAGRRTDAGRSTAAARSYEARLRTATVPAWLSACLLLAGGVAGAQEFTPVPPAALARGAASFLEAGLPPGDSGCELASAAARPFGLEQLDTAALMARIGWRGGRLAVGVAQAGDDLLGWDALGAGLGWAGPEAGFGVRAVARRDRLAGDGTLESSGSESSGIESPRRTAANAPDRAGAGALPGAAPVATRGGGIGGEIGAGGWIVSGRALAWISHSQLATRGASPPLRRGLEFGVAWRSTAAAAWLAHETPPRASGPESHRAGLALGTARGRVWAEARDNPLRAGVGVAARVRALGVAAIVDAHPVLGESVRIELSLSSAGER